ncbi:MAG: MotA/TolQ/ExbB proton channel family protein, partial [Bacteroidota bacterium]
MEQKKPSQSTASLVFTYAVIPASLLICIAVYKFWLGSPIHFIGENAANNPKPGNYWGIIYKGGIIVPVLMSTFLIAITFCVERFVTINRSKGKKNVDQ